MTFEDLPDDWDELPLRDARLVADVLDLVVSERARREGALVLALCDADARLVQPVEIADPATIPAGLRETAVSKLMTNLAQMAPGGCVLVARARSTGLSVTADDETWRDLIEHACAGRLTLLGVHIVTLDGSRPIPRPMAPTQ